MVDSGMVAVLDYFNYKINGEPFRSLCRTKIVGKRISSAEDVWASISSGNKGKTAELRRLKETDVESLIKNGPDKPSVKPTNGSDEEGKDGDEDEDEEEYDPDGICCRSCSGSRFNAWKTPCV